MAFPPISASKHTLVASARHPVLGPSEKLPKSLPIRQSLFRQPVTHPRVPGSLHVDITSFLQRTLRRYHRERKFKPLSRRTDCSSNGGLLILACATDASGRQGEFAAHLERQLAALPTFNRPASRPSICEHITAPFPDRASPPAAGPADVPAAAAPPRAHPKPSAPCAARSPRRAPPCGCAHWANRARSRVRCPAG